MTDGSIQNQAGGNNVTPLKRRFNNVEIGQRPDGYLNATAMCKANGKEWSNYWQNAATKDFVGALEGSLGIPRDVLVVVVTTGPNEQRGTWVHPQVAYHLAQWCSPAFAVQVTEWIHDIRMKGYATAPGVEIESPKPRQRLPRPATEFKAYLSAAKAMGLTGNQAVLCANRATINACGVNILALMELTHLDAPRNEGVMTVTQVADAIKERTGIEIKAQKMNKLMARYGLQAADANMDQRWRPAPKGEPFAVVSDTGKRHSNGTPITQLRWRSGVVDAVADEMRNDPEFKERVA